MSTDAAIGPLDFEAERRRLFLHAYRMLCSVADAEDVVQDAWIRIQGIPPRVIHSTRAYLTQVVTSLCLDRMRKDRARREEYVGPWLPEPCVTRLDEADDESLSIAFLTLLDVLKPNERAVFLLRDVLDLDFATIARAIGRSEAACRQLLHRARERVALSNRPYEGPRAEHGPLIESFFAAIGRGDVPALVELLATDVRLVSDGGGKVTSSRVPIEGSAKVALFLTNIAKFSPQGLDVLPATLNAAPAVLFRVGGNVIATWIFEIVGGKLTRLYSQLNPDKLARVASLTQ